ncbi:hypothetical protein L7F22_038017 [Adiantum nelumboides]|nr:hypothetical protein [Adiantum nelumboides]
MEEIKEGNRKTTTAIVVVRRDIKCTFAPTQGGMQTIEERDNKCHHQEEDNNYQPPIPIQQAPPVQILRLPQQQQPPPPPAPIPPLPLVPENMTISIINFDAKGKAKVEEEEVSLPKGKGKGKGKEKKQEEVDAMPIKRARKEEIADSEADTRRKTKESAKSNKKEKRKPRQKLTIKDFSLGESFQPYDLVDDVSMQGLNISWPQLLYLSPKVCRQWSKMVSTRRVKTKAMGLVSERSLQDIVPVVDAYVEGQCISNVYVDNEVQICVMSEHVFNCLGLKISAPAPYKAKMANYVKVFSKANNDDAKACGDIWPYSLKTTKRGKVSRGKLCEAGNCIRETTRWSNPIDSLSVYAYNVKSKANEAWVEEKQNRDEETTRSSKRATRSSNKKGEVLKPTPEVNMEDALKDKKQGKPRGPSYKLKSNTELATKLKKVFEECILNSKVEMTLGDILGIVKRDFHEAIIDIIKRKRKIPSD